MFLQDKLAIAVRGHARIQDDLGNVLLDKENAVHPQNFARVFARALANEDNYWVHRIAYGNGGTLTDAAYTVTYKTPNDGQPPDVRTWDSRLYNETYSEIVDDSITPSTLLGTDPGSAGPNAGTRPGGGAVASSDPASIAHVSGPGVRSTELGLISQVVITSVLNADEPSGQFGTDSQSTSLEGMFVFDELGLYTTGSPAIDSNGSADIDVNNKTSEDDTGLLAATLYSFIINIDSGGPTLISFTTPAGGGSGTGGEILYGDLCEAINTGDVTWNAAWSGSSPLPGSASIAITDNTLSFPTIAGAQTYGYLRITSGSVGINSTVRLTAGTSGLDLWSSLSGTIVTPNDGSDAGVQNDPVDSSTERERLLTHLIFNPVLKSANRTLTITYTLSITVARTTS